MCVRECPRFEGLLGAPPALDCRTNHLITSCARNCLDFNFSDPASLLRFPPTEYNISQMVCIVSTEICTANEPLRAPPTSPLVIDRVCLPTQAIALLNQTSQFSKVVDINRMSQWLQDLDTAWAMILGSFFIAFVLG